MGPGSPERHNKFTAPLLRKVPYSSRQALAPATSESSAYSLTLSRGMGVQEPFKTFYFFERISLSVALVGLDLTMYDRLVLVSQRSPCF